MKPVFFISVMVFISNNSFDVTNRHINYDAIMWSKDIELINKKLAHFYNTKDNSFKDEHYLVVPMRVYEIERENRIDLSSKYATNNKHNLYFYGTDFRGRSETIVLENVDVLTIEIIGENVAKNKNFIIINGRKIPEIDRSSFEVLTANYSKDKNHVYYSGNILKEADVETFRIDNKIFEHASDKNHKYYGSMISND